MAEHHVTTRSLISISAIVVTIVLAIFGAAFAMISSQDARADELSKDQSNTRAEIAGLKAFYSNVDGRLTRIENKLDKVLDDRPAR